MDAFCTKLCWNLVDLLAIGTLVFQQLWFLYTNDALKRSLNVLLSGVLPLSAAVVTGQDLVCTKHFGKYVMSITYQQIADRQQHITENFNWNSNAVTGSRYVYGGPVCARSLFLSFWHHEQSSRQNLFKTANPLKTFCFVLPWKILVDGHVFITEFPVNDFEIWLVGNSVLCKHVRGCHSGALILQD